MKNTSFIGNRKDAEKEILMVLEAFQDGYTRKDLKTIDTFMEQLFDKEEDIIILGTSDEEWFFNFDEAKELIESDWNWWGDVRFDIDQSIISSTEDNIALVSTTGTVKYIHDNTDETYNRWYNQILLDNYFKDDKVFDKDTAKIDFLELNWLFNHKLHDWGEVQREYLSPIRFTAVLYKKESRWIFKQMQFSFPQPFYPDMRIGSRDMPKERFDNIKEKLGNYKQRKLPENLQEIKMLLSEFQDKYLDAMNVNTSDIVKSFFTQLENTHLIGTDSSKAVGVDHIEQLVEAHRQSWDSIAINIKEAIINQENHVAWIATTGVIMRKQTEEEVLKKQYDNIKNIIKKEATPKDKLFEIRKNISMTLKELEKGNEYIWPVKIEGVLLQIDGIWKFHYLQFSFPFYYILELLRDEELIK